ncbi:cytochrome P450 [Jeotgalicoccus nanhaiensis]|uniref:Cytochrome P450 n=1 Tax=Jeotgalicoccus nanhaiensis TaxID=568603 RepID=A0ABR9XX62_9STAP|nr:cytochrome P450 [Jeotgalicoccus nanhaiensis]MBF0753487.1 cytochrome P450 [Jeotgalicoccus nanhaiensis]TFU62643.1 cytochrome P450 [Jeotgalicoccus nanhaiensis]
MNSNMPKDSGFDKTLSILKEGYEFIMNRDRELDTNIFETRILGEKAICLTGSEQAELFYDNTRFRRSDAAPARVQKTLFGEGGVQGLDGDAHKNRKAMFMSLMDNKTMDEIEDLTEKYWHEFFAEINWNDTVELYEAAKVVFLQVACDWVGVSLEDEDLETRAGQISDLYESPAALGIQHWKGRKSRSEAEDWIQGLIEGVRNGEIEADKDRALYQFAMHKDLDGELLDSQIATVELLNLIRPINAISVWVAMIGLALHEHPEAAEKLQNANQEQLEWFIQEVRRYYPFFPVAVARVAVDFEWQGYEFKEGTLTLLDLYGTNRHPDDWSEPEVFSPERFEGWQQTPFNFIPQGGGSYDFGHRCAGEFITIVVMQTTLDFLVNHLEFEVPDQDFSFEYNDIPAVPNDKVKIKPIRLK